MSMLQKPAPKPMQTPQGYASAASYGSPSSMYIGLPPYGSSLLNGSTVPPYDVGSAYPFNYGTRVSGGTHYRPLQISTPPPYSAGSLIGNSNVCMSFLIVLSFMFYI